MLISYLGQALWTAKIHISEQGNNGIWLNHYFRIDGIVSVLSSLASSIAVSPDSLVLVLFDLTQLKMLPGQLWVFVWELHLTCSFTVLYPSPLKQIPQLEPLMVQGYGFLIEPWTKGSWRSLTIVVLHPRSTYWGSALTEHWQLENGRQQRLKMKWIGNWNPIYYNGARSRWFVSLMVRKWERSTNMSLYLFSFVEYLHY